MRSILLRPLSVVALTGAMALSACGDDTSSADADTTDTSDTSDTSGESATESTQSGTDTTDATTDSTTDSGDGDSTTDTTTDSGDGDATTDSGDGDSTTDSGDGDSTTDSGDGDSTAGDGDATTGDGDGDSTTGDGDGDATTGDGDSATGDGDSGDGDSTTGDGDSTTGDGDSTTGDGDSTTGDGDSSTGGDSTVYDIACSTAGYESLCAAVDKAGLAATLDDPNGTFTVFAPDNDAFAALLGAIGANSLDDVTVEQLTPILLYHVLGTEVDSTAATSAAQSNATIDALGGTIQLGINNTDIELDATAIVDVPDVNGSNGIVHGITAVILPSITDVVVTDPNFSSLEAALGLADTDSSNPNLVGTLDDNDGTFTVFAPPDPAFTALIGALPAEAGIAGLGDISSTQVLPILRYHVVGGAAVTAANVTDGPIGTLGGTVVADTSNGVAIDSASVTVADIYTANGVIHVVDGVLIPSIADTVTTAPEFTQLAGLVAAADADAGTTPKLGPVLDGAASNGAFTVFAPTNDAITTLVAAISPNVPSGQDLTNIILYHAIDGAAPGVFASTALGLTDADVPTAFGGLPVTVNGGSGVTVEPSAFGIANVVTTDYLCANGVIHAIDDVLIPPDSAEGSTTGIGETFGSGGLGQQACADVVISDTGTISGAPTVTIGLDHGLIGDLTITLSSPDGSDVVLMAEPGGGVLGDTSNLSAAFPITFQAGGATDAANMGGTIDGGSNVCEDDGECVFAPNPGDLADFVGEASNGTWTLCVDDGNGNFGNGSLESVSISAPI